VRPRRFAEGRLSHWRSLRDQTRRLRRGFLWGGGRQHIEDLGQAVSVEAVGDRTVGGHSL
jgi:hypothetical protein